METKKGIKMTTDAMKKPKYNQTSLFLEISPCYQNCRHCWISDHIKKPRSLEETKNIVEDYSRVLDIPDFTGSARIYILDEPSLYPEIIELLSFAGSKGIIPVPCLSTNGIGFVTRKNWEEIFMAFKEQGVWGLHMSIFGDRETHNEFSGRKNSYELLREAADRAKTLGFKLHWNLFVTKESYKQLSSMIESIKGDKFTISIPSWTINWEKWKSIHATCTEYKLNERNYFGDIPLYITEKEFSEQCIADKNGARDIIERIDRYFEGWPDYTSKALYISGNGIFDHESSLPCFKIGEIFNDRINLLFKEEIKSQGLSELKEADLKLLAKKFAKADNSSLGLHAYYQMKWFLMEKNLL